jgi:hypothetical protein
MNLELIEPFITYSRIIKSLLNDQIIGKSKFKNSPIFRSSSSWNDHKNSVWFCQNIEKVRTKSTK